MEKVVISREQSGCSGGKARCGLLAVVRVAVGLFVVLSELWVMVGSRSRSPTLSLLACWLATAFRARCFQEKIGRAGKSLTEDAI